MATDEIASLISSLGNKENLTIFELLSTGKVCECEIAEQLHIKKIEVSERLQPLVDAGTITNTLEGSRNMYCISEKGVCLLNRYFNDIIYRCRSAGLKCKCGSKDC